MDQLCVFVVDDEQGEALVTVGYEDFRDRCEEDGWTVLAELLISSVEEGISIANSVAHALSRAGHELTSPGGLNMIGSVFAEDGVTIAVLALAEFAERTYGDPSMAYQVGYDNFWDMYEGQPIVSPDDYEAFRTAALQERPGELQMMFTNYEEVLEQGLRGHYAAHYENFGGPYTPHGPPGNLSDLGQRSFEQNAVRAETREADSRHGEGDPLDPGVSDPLPPMGFPRLVSTASVWRSHEYVNGQEVEYDFEAQHMRIESHYNCVRRQLRLPRTEAQMEAEERERLNVAYIREELRKQGWANQGGEESDDGHTTDASWADAVPLNQRPDIEIRLLQVTKFIEDEYDAKGYLSFRYYAQPRLRMHYDDHTREPFKRSTREIDPAFPLRMALNFLPAPYGGGWTPGELDCPGFDPNTLQFIDQVAPPQFALLAEELREGVSEATAERELTRTGYKSLEPFPGQYRPWRVLCAAGHVLNGGQEPGEVGGFPLPKLLWMADHQERLCKPCKIDHREMNVFVYLARSGNKLKVGMTNAPPMRMSELDDSTPDEHPDAKWTVVDASAPMPRGQARSLEARLLSGIDKEQIPRGRQKWDTRFDGYTETWSADDLEVETLAELEKKLS